MAVEVKIKMTPKQAGALYMAHNKLKTELVAANLLIDTLYESGCLDEQRTAIVQAYFAGES